MKVDKSQLSVDLQKIVMEMEDIISRSKISGKYCLKAVNDRERGYEIFGSDSEIMIHYALKLDFCRALSWISSSEKKHIEEKRIFHDFGYVVDCSRNAVISTDTAKKLIKCLAWMGYGFLGLYIEDTICIKDEPYFGYMRGAFKDWEIKEIVSYADIFGMEIRPYIQTLAHLNQIKRYEDYQQMMDTDDILLIGEERTYQFLDRLIETIARAFHTDKINIGMDEAHMVGLGTYLERNGYQNRFEVMSCHLKRVMEICQKYGLQPQMWSDMFFRLAYGGAYYVEKEDVSKMIQIPEGLEIVYWDYCSCDESRYDSMLKKHLEITKRTGFAGGAWKWTGFTPHNAYSIESGRAALTACKKNRIESVVITGWGDNGAESSTFSVLPSLFFDANLAYESDLPKEAFYNLTGIEWQDFLLIDIANPYSEEKEKHNNAGKYFLYNDLFMNTFDSVVPDKIRDYYIDADQKLCNLMQKYPHSDYLYLFETQQKLCRVLEDKANLGRRIREAYVQKKRQELVNISVIEIPELIEHMELFYQTFKKQWMIENKSFGFEVQTIRLGGSMKRFLDVGDIIKEYLNGEKKSIEELEEKLLPFHYFNDDTPQTLNYNLWSDIVTPGVIG